MSALGMSLHADSYFLRFFGSDVARFFCGFGFAFMSISMACSKLSGWSETGLAFGIGCPPMAKRVVRSWADTSSEHASAAACSAFCYDIGKDIGILPVIMPVRKLCQVQRQVFFADLMEGANHTTFQQAPEGFDVIRMDVSAHIFLLAVFHDLMREEAFQRIITIGFVSGHQGYSVADRLSHESSHRCTVGPFNHLADHITLASNRAAHGHLLGTAAHVPLLIPMTVFIF